MANNPRRQGPPKPPDDQQSPAETTAATEQPQAEQPQAEQPKTDQPKPQQPSRLNITDLKDMSIQKLTQIAKDLSVAGVGGMRKQDLIFQILKAQTEQSGFIFSEGVLEVLPDRILPDAGMTVL